MTGLAFLSTPGGDSWHQGENPREAKRRGRISRRRKKNRKLNPTI
jgi:hypothetical protein